MSTHKSEVQRVTVGNWNIDLQNDCDGHLTVGISNQDGSKVHDVGETAIECNDEEIVTRYSTAQIEEDYEATIEPEHDPDCCPHGLPHFCPECDG